MMGKPWMISVKIECSKPVELCPPEAFLPRVLPGQAVCGWPSQRHLHQTAWLE
ncbi:hypothetical protein J4Q44_G00327440 [Coregonus suidteri]|uniref:Uncharacterized protein n=1 Tax=Coregonus suidteri TaxID=861788 RepID=A0AAN8QP83_9TELE